MKRDGAIELAKVDVDANPMLAQAFGIRGIPDVRAFRDAKIVSQFTGALPPAQISAFLDTLLPSEADELAKAGDEDVAPRRPGGGPRPLRARPLASRGSFWPAARPTRPGLSWRTRRAPTSRPGAPGADRARGA